MNNPNTSMLTNPLVFHEIVNASGMSAMEAIKHIGKISRQIKVDERKQSAERLKNLEENSHPK